MPRRKRNAFPFVDLWFVQFAQAHRIDLELIGQFVHRRLGREQAGHGTRSAHRSWRTDVSARAAPVNSKIWHAVEVRCRLTTVFVITAEDIQVVEIVLPQRHEVSFIRGAETHALLSARAMTD